MVAALCVGAFMEQEHCVPADGGEGGAVGAGELRARDGQFNARPGDVLGIAVLVCGPATTGVQAVEPSGLKRWRFG
jgi:hypothetical protein